MKYDIRFKSSARKEYESLAPSVRSRVRVAIDGLQENPRPFGVIKLTNSGNEYRIRVGDYRIVYTIEDTIHIVEIQRIRNRGDVYRKR